MGLINGKVYLEKNYILWKKLFNDEKEKLKNIFKCNDFQIEHVGSTSINGLSAKPIVDIAVGVDNLNDIKKYINQLKCIYTVKDNTENEEILLIKENEKVTFFLIHVLNKNSDRFKNMLKFRDTLRKNSGFLKEYEELKIYLADKYKNNREMYTKSKNGFINKVLLKSDNKKNVLIATTNKDKYNIVYKLFKKTIFMDDIYEISCLTDEMNVPDEKESGNNVERARKKALNAFNHLKEYKFDYIVGLDDALVIKGRVEPNIKEYINKILYENYLDDGEEYAFNRAYCIIDKDENIYEVDLDIPEIYHSLKDDFKPEEHSYPLSHVSYPIGYNKPVCDLSEEEATNYYLKYVYDGLMNLKIK